MADPNLFPPTDPRYDAQGDQYGPLGQFNWATQGTGGSPVPVPVQPVDSGPGVIAALMRGNASGANGLDRELPGSAKGVAPRSPETNAPVEPTTPENEIQNAYRLAMTDPTKVSVAQWGMLQRLGVLERTDGQAGAGGAGSVSQSNTTGWSQRLMSPEAKASLGSEQGIREGMAGRTAELGQAQAAASAENAKAATGYADQLQGLAAERSQAQAEQADRMEKLQGDVTRASSDYVKQAQSLDPNRIMKGKEWVGALAMALGSFSAAVNKGPNYAKQILDSAIDRDLDKQKTAIGAAKDKVSFAQQIYQDQRTRFTDRMAAMEATRGDIYNIMAAKAEARAQATKGTEQAQNALNFADQMRLEGQARMTNALEMESKTTSSQSTTTTAVGGAGTGTNGKQPEDALARAKRVAEAKLVFDKAYGTGPSEKDQTLYNEVAGRIPDLVSAVKATDRLRKSNEDTNFVERTFPKTASFFGDDAGIRQKANETIATTKSLQAESGKAFTEPELKAKKETLQSGVTSNQRNVGVGVQEQSLIDTWAAHLGSLHPTLRKQALERMQAAGLPAHIIRAVATQSATSNDAADGSALGLVAR